MKLEDLNEQELKYLSNSIATAVQVTFQEFGIEPKVPGTRNQFVVLFFDDPKIAQYVSTCTRDSIIEAMRECADRLEGKQDVPR